MVPIFSFRSLLSLFIGLIVGTALGFGYASLNSNTAELNAGWPPIRITSSPESRIFTTSIQGRVLPVTNDDTFIRNMELQDQYYAAIISSMSFFQYYSDIIEQQYPQYAITPEILARIVKVEFITLANNPSVIQITVSGSSAEESLFIAQNLPAVFEGYLQNQQNQIQYEAYQNKIKQIELTRTALLKAGQDLINSTTEDQTPPTILTQEYIELSAKVAALEDELDSQTKKAASLLAQGVPPTPTSQAATISNSPVDLDTRVKGIVEALTMQARISAGIVVQVNPENPQPYTTSSQSDLDQAYWKAASLQYVNAINAIEITSTELSKARVEMDKLTVKINQEKADFDNSNAEKKLAYTLASEQIKYFTSRLDIQIAELQATDQSVPNSKIPKFYVSAAPLPPTPVSSGKSAPVLGAMIGLFCGWLVVNRRWLLSNKNTANEAFNDENTQYPPVDNAEPDIDKDLGSDNWLNEGIYAPKPSGSENDDWLNVGINKVSNNLPENNPQDESHQNEWSPAQPDNNSGNYPLNTPANAKSGPPPKVDTNDWFAGEINMTPEGNVLKEDDRK